MGRRVPREIDLESGSRSADSEAVQEAVNPRCCWILPPGPTAVLLSGLTFALSLVVFGVGAALLAQAQGWELPPMPSWPWVEGEPDATDAPQATEAERLVLEDLKAQITFIGGFAIGFGLLLALTSVVGCCAGCRSAPHQHVTACSAAFLLLLLLTLAAQLLALVYAFVEGAELGSFLERHWDLLLEKYLEQNLLLEKWVDLSEAVSGGGGATNLTNVTGGGDLLGGLQSYLWAIGGLEATITVLLLVQLGCVTKLMGVRVVTSALLVTLFLMGLAQLAVALANFAAVTGRQGLPTSTIGLLLGGAAVQLISATLGFCGFRLLSRDCIGISFLVLLGGLAMNSVTASQAWKAMNDAIDGSDEASSGGGPSLLPSLAADGSALVVLALSLTSLFLSLITLGFMVAQYLSLSKAWAAQKQRAIARYNAANPVQFSEYSERRRAQGLSGRPKPGPSRSSGRVTRITRMDSTSMSAGGTRPPILAHGGSSLGSSSRIGGSSACMLGNGRGSCASLAMRPPRPPGAGSAGMAMGTSPVALPPPRKGRSIIPKPAIPKALKGRSLLRPWRKPKPKVPREVQLARMATRAGGMLARV